MVWVTFKVIISPGFTFASTDIPFFFCHDRLPFPAKKEIAESTVFRSPSHLINLLKKHEGIPLFNIKPIGKNDSACRKTFLGLAARLLKIGQTFFREQQVQGRTVRVANRLPLKAAPWRAPRATPLKIVAIAADCAAMAVCLLQLL